MREPFDKLRKALHLAWLLALKCRFHEKSPWRVFQGLFQCHPQRSGDVGIHMLVQAVS